MLIASFSVPPLGIIDSSILAAVGEVFTFSGGLIGIDYTYKYKWFNFKQSERRHKDNTDTGVSSSDESDA